VVFLGLQINSSQYLYDISGLPSQLAVIFPSGGTLVVDDSSFHFAPSNCSEEVSILIPSFFEQLNGSSTTVAKRHDDFYLRSKNKRTESAFQVYLQLTNQCNALVTSEIFPADALKVGKSPCTLLPAPQTNQNIGVWAFNCLYPGLNSPEDACKTALTNALDAFDSKMDAIGKALGKFQCVFSLFLWQLIKAPLP